MRRVHLAACLLCLLVAADAAAATRAARIDALFERLEQADSREQALRIEFAIWDEWLHPADAGIARLMQAAMTARDHYDYAQALRLLEQVSERAPGYAEAWNQRATIHFQKGQYEQSLRAIAETLEREPRHFGALTGRGLIRMRQGKPALACQSIHAALRIHPFIPERRLCPSLNRDGGRD